MSLSEEVRNRIEGLIKSEQVVLFMKGKRRMPQCGFSATVVGILDQLDIEYKTVDVLADPDVRSGLKIYADWPTIPQLYIDGEFIGGCDIVNQSFSTGELDKLLGKDYTPSIPEVTVTEAAMKALLEAKTDEDPDGIRFVIAPNNQFGLSFSDSAPGDATIDLGQMKLYLDRMTSSKAHGTTIDFVDGDVQGFRVTNPNFPNG